jgi:hypothetical protein
MSMAWMERIRDTILHWHSSRWHPASTAPCNQDIELRIVEDGSTITLPFPCRQTNEGEWINVDLGTSMQIRPVSWRVWRHSKSPHPHHSLIKGNERPALHHREHWTRGKDT